MMVTSTFAVIGTTAAGPSGYENVTWDATNGYMATGGSGYVYVYNSVADVDMTFTSSDLEVGEMYELEISVYEHPFGMEISYNTYTWNATDADVDVSGTTDVSSIADSLNVTTPTFTDTNYRRRFAFDNQNNITNNTITNNNTVNTNEDNTVTTNVSETDNEYADRYKRQIDLSDGNKKERAVPNLAYLGMGAGLLPAAYAYLRKQPDAEQAKYTPGFTSPVVAYRGRSPRLERFDYNQDIANVGSEVRGMNKYIESSGGGPANMVNKMMAFSRGQQAKNKIRAAETRANVGVQNTEAQLKQQMTLDNLRRQQSASIFNAQMARAEAARKDQIDEANTARRQQRTSDMEYMKYAAVGNLGQAIQTGIGDVLDYKADMAQAEAIGTGSGNVYRDAQLINAGYSLDTNTGVWSKGDKTISKFGGLRRLQNYNR